MQRRDLLVAHVGLAAKGRDQLGVLGVRTVPDEFHGAHLSEAHSRLPRTREAAGVVFPR